ncbi:MAG: ribosome recycling factor [Chloroflexi bacterium]|jgi:ribosome recycling factor|nr:ribosome recycling factor [Chloroflexota bacterium]
MIQDVLTETETKMKKAMDALRRELQNIRTGRAVPGLIEKIPVDVYGTSTPLNQLGSVTAPEARLLVVQPWDKNTMGAIEKAIQKSELNLTTNNDGKVIRIPIPALTEQRRKELVKVVKSKVEDSKVTVRNIRRDNLNDIKELLHEKLISEDEDKRAHEKIQSLTDKYIMESDQIGHHKEQEILEV